MTEQQICQLNLAGFEMTILGRQFPDSHDVWDGNWLNVVCKYQNSEATGPFLSVGEIADFQSKLKQTKAGKIDYAEVEIMEPELSLALSNTADRQMLFKVQLLPDDKKQFEHCEFKINQNEIAAAIEQCQTILQAYPLRGI